MDCKDYQFKATTLFATNTLNLNDQDDFSSTDWYAFKFSGFCVS